jgi:hypothetical protein
MESFSLEALAFVVYEIDWRFIELQLCIKHLRLQHSCRGFDSKAVHMKLFNRWKGIRRNKHMKVETDS